MDKNSLVSLPGNLENPRNTTASDFPSSGGMKAGMAEGKNELTKQSENQEGPRHAEDSGDGTPSVWGKGGKGFSVGQSKSETGTAMSGREGVDFVSGKITGKK
jgi:hypothetical protein